MIFYDANITIIVSASDNIMARSAARDLLPLLSLHQNPESVGASYKRERESTEISDTNEETNISISIEVAAPYSMEVATP